jgi:4-cresol dehydrogenase (hydroxylating)
VIGANPYAASCGVVDRSPQVAPTAPDWNRAIPAWKSVLTEGAVSTTRGALSTFHTSTVGVRREVKAVVCPSNEAEVQEVVRIANRYRAPIYPVSTGRNWGYGDSSPVVDGCAVVNLSRMNRIVDFNSSGPYAVANVQPGVTQQVLFDYLQKRKLQYMVPVHGGGPDCSLIGNALERGYGITPIANHFDAMTSIRAVLADGTLYESFFERVGASAIGDRRKSQVGLDIDGLFAQSNLGIVTQAKIRLRRRPRHIAAVLFRLESQQALADAAAGIEELLYEHAPKAIGAVNLMNRLRVLAMLAPYPVEARPHGTISEQQLLQLGRHYDVPEWVGAATVYGECPAAIRQVFAAFRTKLRKIAQGLTLCDSAKLKRARFVMRLLPGLAARYQPKVNAVATLLEIASGKPGRVALPLTRWRSRGKCQEQPVLDPAAERSGIIWYSPYVPITARHVEEYRTIVERVCREHGIEPLITLTTVDDQTFDSTVPLLFDNAVESERTNAQACYRELLRQGLNMGVIPYRYGIDEMRSLAGLDRERERISLSIKRAFDGREIIAPGRYAGPGESSSVAATR